MTNNESKGSNYVDPLEGMIATSMSAKISTLILTATKQSELSLNVASYAAAMALLGILAEQHKIFTKDGVVILIVDQVVQLATKLLHDNEASSAPQPSNN